MYLCIYLLANMYVTFIQCLRRPEEGVGSLANWSYRWVNHHMGAGNRPQVCKSSQCSETLRCEFIQSTSLATEGPEKVELHPGLGTCHHPVMVCHHEALVCSFRSFAITKRVTVDRQPVSAALAGPLESTWLHFSCPSLRQDRTM